MNDEVAKKITDACDISCWKCKEENCWECICREWRGERE